MDTPADVRLVVPAAPEFLRLIRLTAAALGSRLGFTYDEVEDLRIAIDELCFTLIGTAGRAGQLVLQYSMRAEGLAVEGLGQFEDDDWTPIVSPISQQILSSVVDDHEVSSDGNPRFRLLKRHVGAAAS
jgi:hypothetical protein